MLLKKIGSFIALSLVSSFLLNFVLASEIEKVERLAKQTVHDVIEVLKQKQLPVQERADQVIAILNSVVDYPQIAYWIVGKRRWKSYSKAERKEASQNLTRVLKNSFFDKLDLYDGEEVVFKKTQQPKKNRIEIITSLEKDGEGQAVIYKFHMRKKKWLLYDLEIEGVSLLRTSITQYASFSKKDLLEFLKTVK